MKIDWMKKKAAAAPKEAVKPISEDMHKMEGPKGDTKVSTQPAKEPAMAVKPTSEDMHKDEGVKEKLLHPTAADKTEEITMEDLFEKVEEPVHALQACLDIVRILKLAKQDEAYLDKTASLENQIQNLLVQATDQLADSPEALLADVEQKVDIITETINKDASVNMNRWMKMMRGKLPIKSRRQFEKAFKKALEEMREKEATLKVASMLTPEIVKAAQDAGLLEKPVETVPASTEAATPAGETETTKLEQSFWTKMSSWAEDLIHRFAKDPNPAEAKAAGESGKLTNPTGQTKMPTMGTTGTPAEQGYKEPGVQGKLNLNPGSAAEPKTPDMSNAKADVKSGAAVKAPGETGGTKKAPKADKGTPSEAVKGTPAASGVKETGEVAAPLQKQFSQINWFQKTAAIEPQPTDPAGEGFEWALGEDGKWIRKVKASVTPAQGVIKKEAATEEAQKWISDKIALLRGEGKDAEQAAAIAYSMAREKGYDVPEKKASVIPTGALTEEQADELAKSAKESEFLIEIKASDKSELTQLGTKIFG